MFWASTAIVLAYMLGYRTRITAPLFAIIVWSIYHRNPWITNGGTRLLCIISIYLVLADVGRYFAVGRSEAKAKSSSPLSCMLHNTSVILVIVQLMIVYLFSTFYKIDGASWQQGTGLYYSLMDPEFYGSPLVSLITHSPLLITLGSYSTLLYQSAFPWLILNKQTKLFTVFVGLMFHFGIAVVMGLWWFSAVLMACEAVVLSDEQYRSIFSYMKKVFAGNGTSAAQTLRLENLRV
jgi:hypothetical protein